MAVSSIEALAPGDQVLAYFGEVARAEQEQRLYGYDEAAERHQACVRKYSAARKLGELLAAYPGMTMHVQALPPETSQAILRADLNDPLNHYEYPLEATSKMKWIWLPNYEAPHSFSFTRLWRKAGKYTIYPLNRQTLEPQVSITIED